MRVSSFFIYSIRYQCWCHWWQEGKMFKQEGFQIFYLEYWVAVYTHGLLLAKISMSDVDKLILFVIVDSWCRKFAAGSH